ncbi:MAG: bifunctional phosphopantothenoylcysteine decarboxylase/phosphopantothenate--cysteine ligase CoaBC [Deltaproteobacteria bacterium]|nr:bifunctional phosphopantothenoylcysteine decarboxylase/phosphopantothenate--cysteine ligase CoaBC [Deltaproteobacteria bacterium]
MIYAGKRILLGVTGGIAAYKAAELTRRFICAGAQVKVVMTAAAREFVTPLTFEALSGEKVATAMFGPNAAPLEHVSLGQEADAIVIAPATANLLGKLAAGIGDDLLTTILLAATRPALLCPAMNVEMWRNPVVQENLERLRDRGLKVLDPATGELACGAVGLGRLPEPEVIVEAAASLVSRKDLLGQRVLVTAGPTHEDCDPVRFLTNRSSGKMGYALARVAWRRGAEVWLVSGPSALSAPYGVERVWVRSAREMLAAVQERFSAADALLMAAAVGDYRPVKCELKKIKRGREEVQMQLAQNPDILRELNQIRKRQVMVGFAAETHDQEAEARRKLEEKHLDFIVANDVTRKDAGFAVDTNQVTILSREREPERLPLLTKEEVAELILDRVAELLMGRGREGRGGA